MVSYAIINIYSHSTLTVSMLPKDTFTTTDVNFGTLYAGNSARRNVTLTAPPGNTNHYTVSILSFGLPPDTFTLTMQNATTHAPMPSVLLQHGSVIVELLLTSEEDAPTNLDYTVDVTFVGEAAP